jgi:hypothetical protein
MDYWLFPRENVRPTRGGMLNGSTLSRESRITLMRLLLMTIRERSNPWVGKSLFRRQPFQAWGILCLPRYGKACLQPLGGEQGREVGGDGGVTSLKDIFEERKDGSGNLDG